MLKVLFNKENYKNLICASRYVIYVTFLKKLFVVPIEWYKWVR